MKRLFNNRTTGNTSSEKTLQQGRLANMRTLTLRRLFSLAGLTIMLGAVAFVAYGANITCSTADCVGTEFSDVINDATGGDSEDETIRGLGGDDVINSTTGDGSGTTGDTVLAGPGDDRVNVSSGNDTVVFGEDGSDFINVTGAAEHTLKGGRGGDTFVTDATDSMQIVDGPGADSIQNKADDSTASHTINLVNDNEQDIFIGDDSASETVFLGKGSGRDVIDCGDGGGTVHLKGNRKATDTEGNNLRKAALFGGTAQTGCDMIIP